MVLCPEEAEYVLSLHPDAADSGTLPEDDTEAGGMIFQELVVSEGTGPNRRKDGGGGGSR